MSLVIGAKYNSSVCIIGDASVGTHFLSSNLPSPINLTITLKHKFNGVSQPLLACALPEYAGVRGRGNRAYAATVEPPNVYGEAVFVKWAKGQGEVDLLEHEAKVYVRLKHLWGSAVPKFHGYFRGPQDRPAVACLILELCLGASTPSWRDVSRQEFDRLAYDSLEKIHQAGVLHRSLLADVQGCPRAHVAVFPDDPRIQMQHFLLWNGRVLLIDFVYAELHRCTRRVEAPARGGRPYLVSNCLEFALLHELGMEDPSPMTKAPVHRMYY